MAGQSTKTTAAKRTQAKRAPVKRTPVKRTPAAPPAPDERDGLSLTDLAGGILSKAVRPRTADIRRLAEAVIAGGSAKPKKARKADGGGKKDKGKKNKKKLAKIPGQSKN